MTSNSKIWCLKRRLSLGQGPRCRPRSRVADVVDKFPVTLLVEMLDPIVIKMVLRFHVEDGDRVVRDQLLDEAVSQNDVFFPEESR